MKRALIALVFLLGGCSSASDTDRCLDIEEDIRRRAIAAGYDGDRDGLPDAKGVCRSATPEIQRDFKQACADLLLCRAM